MMVRSALTVPEKAEDLAGIPGGCVAAVDQSDAGTHDGGAADARGGDRRAHPLVPRRSARWLALAEREAISRGIVAGHSGRLIGGRIRRAGSTVSIREIAWNGGRRRYRAGQAEQAAPSRARRPKAAQLGACPRLRQVVEAKLASRWSPQQIAGWLTRAEPDDRELRVAHETIDLSLLVQPRGALHKGADPLPPIAPDGPSAARGTSGQWPGPTAQRGQQQRPSRSGDRSRRARAP